MDGKYTSLPTQLADSQWLGGPKKKGPHQVTVGLTNFYVIDKRWQQLTIQKQNMLWHCLEITLYQHQSLLIQHAHMIGNNLNNPHMYKEPKVCWKKPWYRNTMWKNRFTKVHGICVSRFSKVSPELSPQTPLGFSTEWRDGGLWGVLLDGKPWWTLLVEKGDKRVEQNSNYFMEKTLD